MEVFMLHTLCFVIGMLFGAGITGYVLDPEVKNISKLFNC